MLMRSASGIALLTLTTLFAGILSLGWHGPERRGAWAGVATAALASALTLLLLRLTQNRGLKPVLVAVVGGLLCRMVLVAAGLLLAIHFQANLIAFCVAFFTLFLSHQVIELTAVMRAPRPLYTEGKR